MERMVLCNGPDAFLVALRGRLGGVFHVRVHVWEVVGVYDRLTPVERHVIAVPARKNCNGVPFDRGAYRSTGPRASQRAISHPSVRR